MFSIVAAAAMAGLWLAVPNADETTIFLVLASFVVATAAIEFTTVFTNAIMPTLVPKAQVGRLSGIGWGVGYAGGILALLVMAGLIVTDPSTDTTLLGLKPVLPLNAAAREGDRLVGPFSALWLLVFILPFFLFTPDRGKRAHIEPGTSALASLWATLKELPIHRGILIFLIARMVYIDGLTAIFTFGGIYGAAVFGWGAFELGLFGITLAVMGAVGAVIGGVLDDRIGAKWVIVGALALLLIAAIGILSVDGAHVLFTLKVTPKAAGSAAFSSAGEQVYLAFSCLVGLVAAPVQAASRSLLARLAPPDQMTQFFGLFAFSGKVTAFAAPTLVALVTTISGSQRAGVSVIAIFLIVGLMLMLAVRVNEFRGDG
jgi:UMF1 family MFS transporter